MLNGAQNAPDGKGDKEMARHRRRRHPRKHACKAVKITRGPMRGHWRNPCTGKLARKPRKG